MRNLLLHNKYIAKYFRVVFALIFIFFLTGKSFSQCPTLKKVSVGECTNTGAGSKVLVAWVFDFDNSGNYTITVNDGNGNTLTKTIGPNPANNGTPFYLQEIVTPNGNTYTSQISISGGCGTSNVDYTLPPACPLNPTCGSGNLGGLVFADYDLDGAQGGSEGGLKGVIVKIYDDNQNMVATATTDVQGKWLATGLTNGQKLRIEYDYSSFPNVNPYKLGKKTGTTETTVQFATVPDCSNNLGLFLEEIYTDPNPRAATIRFMNANNLSPNSCSGAEQYVVVSYDYNASGPQFGSEGYNVPIDQGIAKAKDVGLVWGMAWNKYTGHVYTSAALRRHASTGPNGIGAIYASKQTAPGGAWATTLLIDLVSAGYDLGQNDMNWANRGLPDCKNDPSNDPEAYGLVGKVGFGDIDISADGTKLYAVNLKSRSLIILTLNAAGNMVTGQTEVPIPNPCANPIDWRPWALKVYKGKVYVGGVNAGYSSPNNYPNDDYHRLRAYVYEYDPTTGTFSTPILEQPLDYPHQGDGSTTRWYCWEDDYTVVLNNGWHQQFNQPILSDIEFDSYGNILLAYTDRGGIQWGWMNYPPAGTSLEYYFADGDITKGYKNEEGIFLTEDNGKIGYDTGCGSGGGNGPGGGEFYCGDNKYHPECAQGAVASHPSKNEMFMTFMDPYNIWSGGIGVLSHTDGQNQRGIELYYNNGGGNTGWFGKAGGVGDVELLSSPISAVKQIGNRIWHDADYDGIQDPGEAPLSGIAVSLYNSGGTLVANTTTDANGEYYFENYVPNSTYYIVVGEGGQFNTTTGKLNNLYSVTKNDIGMGDIPDLNDSDGTLKPSGFLTGYPYIQITTPNLGEVNHSYDFGFFPLAEIGNYVWQDVNANGLQDDGNTGLNGYEVKLYKGDGTFLSSTTTANHPTNGNPGYYLFPNLVPGDYYVCFNKGTNFLTTQDVGGNDATDSDADPVSGCTIPTTLSPGESDMSWDAGIVIPCNITIGDYVWHDNNYNGIQDNGEQGISGVLVELLNSGGTVIATTTTNGSGKYEFKNISNVGVQNYTVRIAASNFAAGGVFESSQSLKWYASPKNQGGDDAKDSDGDVNDHTATVSMLCNTDLTIDFGFYKTCMTITKSANKTTARPGEVITYIFTVTNCGDVPLGGGVDFYDALLNPTPPHHIHNITPVNPGETKSFTKDYTVVVADCEILVNTVTAIGHPVDGSANLTQTATYTIDINCKASIGNYVWEDKNANGIQDDGNTGINGIEVKLYTGAGVYVATKLTANNPVTGQPGYYVFTELEPGDYYVCFNKGVYVITTKDAGGDDATDSDADETTGCTVTTTLSQAENDMTWDAGLFKLASLGDYVWMDRDEDGCQDIDENPIKNVKVNLFKDDNTDGVPDGPAIAQTQTDVNGFYQFINLRPGNYIVGFEKPAGYKTIPQNSASCGDNMDSDASEITGLTGTINLESGEHDPTIDAGFKLRFDLALIKHDPAFPAKMGQPLTFNIEVFNQSEPGADVQAVEIVDYINLTAYDFNPAINPGWTLTGNKAKYVYNGPLLAQTSVIIPIILTVKYTATEATLKNEAEISSFKDMEGETQTEEKDSYPDDNPDNDNDVQCGSPDDDNINGNVKEFPGQDEDDNDVACVEIFDLALKKLETSTGPYNFGDNVTFTMTVYNQGTVPATNIKITDYIPSGFEYNPALNPLWTQSNTTTPETTINSTLNPGANTSVTIVLTLKSTNDLANGWVNRAEISRAENTSGINLSDYDWDSNLDSNPNNDAGGNPDTGSDNSIDGNGTGNPGDTNPATDEDDADPARVKVYDLALTKKLLTPEPYTYYQDHTFEIEVFNQGNEIMKDVVVSDYIPSGYTFSAASNPGWTGTAPTVSRTIAQIDPGQSVKIQIVLKLIQTNGGSVNWDNYAEIVSAKDKNGVNATTWDADSNPASDSPHERAVKPGSTDDDNINGHYIPDGTDEDDHDPAGPKVFDLALKKVETSTGAYRYGDQVTFTYTVYNQGNIAAKDIEVMDYVPSGFKYVPALNPTWTQAVVTTPKKVIAGPLAPGATTTVTIILVAQATTDFVDGWTNFAEIVKAKDPQGNDMSDKDLDSDLDNDPNNDIGGTPDTPEDDMVTDDGNDGDGDGVTDEDDSDPARVKVYDLALTKKLLTPEPYTYYQNHTFEIEVFNQGNEIMKDVVISDYIPAGYTYNAALNAGWTGAAPTVSRTIAQINPGQSVKIQIVLKLIQTNGGSVNWDNYAEIVSAKDKNGVNATTWDADSNPGSDAAHERAVKPGSTDDDNIDGHYIPDGTDEDDHDPAGPKVFDLALKKVETSTGAYRYGDQVTFTYTVYNQGNIAAKDIEVIDYVPSGFKYVPALNPGWTPAVVSTPKKVIAGPLAPGATTTLTIILVAQPTTDIVDGWTNFAEIVKAKDPQGNDMSDKDLDSDLDNDPNNDVGGTPDTPEDNMVTDDGKDGDGDGVTDEDDADPARVKIYDLALTKKVVTQKPYSYYQDITFEIEVFNQGNEIMKNVVVNDYIPLGYTFSAAINPGWSGAAPIVNRTIAQINPGQSVKIQIVLKLAQTNGGETHWDNYAEVASAQDKNGIDATTWDADSNPGSDAAHERAVKPGDADDDNINGHYVPDGTDEDDHDPAGIEVLDLALRKKTASASTFQYDQIVVFQLEIFNQGNEIAHDISVVDYVPSGYIYLPHLNPNWTQALTSTPSTTIQGPLAPGQSTSVIINLQLQYTPEVGGYVNRAEISGAKDEQNNPFDDIDSDPDTNPNNDIGGTPLTPEDDHVNDDGKDGNGDGITDEDDEDPWTVPVSSIGNYVWYDNNDNGIQDDGLPSVVGVKDVLVILNDCSDNEVLRMKTDANGHYSFPNLIPGNYKIKFEDLPNNTIWAKQNIGNDALDSDPDANGLAICTNLAPGEDDPTWDAGILKLASLGDFVWLDTDSDGIQDADESSVAGITVRLLDANGNIIQTTLTNEQGLYLFDSLRPGTYYVQFVKPNGLEFTLPVQGGDPNKDSNANPADGRTGGVILAAGDNRRDIDAGLKCTIDVQVSADVIVCQGESVTITSQVTGGAPPITYLWSNSGTGPNITVTPQSTTVYKLTVTDKYGCEDTDEAVVTVEPKAKIGDRVWMDIDRDGIQDYYIGDPDLDENGINGVTVNLYKASNPNTVFMTQITHTFVDTTGYYEFEVCKGDYFVEFIPPTGSGYLFTLQDQGGNDFLDSDANPATGRTISTYLSPGEIDHTWDAGFYLTASLGDRVWHDIDADGIQDPNEPGIPGVGVTLRDGNGTVIATTTTNAQGNYEFTGLVPDDYYVCFDISGSGYDRVSPRNTGFNDAVDSDADPVTGCTEITTIVANENDLTWDLGLFNLASLGDYVWLDKDADGCQDAGESGISGVIVRLYRDNDANGVPDGAQLAQTTTNATGYYIFNNLMAGTYLVKFDKPSAAYKTSPKNKNTLCDDTSDSDGDPIFGYSDPIVLTDNEHDPSIDQGYYQTAKVGDFVWYDIDGDGIQDSNEPGIPGVVVTLYKDTDGDGIPDTAISTKTTNSGADAGKYLFDNVDPGVYKICFDASNTQYEGFTKVDQGGNDATDSDASLITGCTPVFTVQSGDDNRTFDAGLIILAELGDYVWEDRNADGYQDPTELPIANVKVELLDINGTVLGTKFTDANGFYKFEDLYPGDYIVRFTKPSGFEPTTQNNPISDAKDSDANPVSGLSHIVNLEAGESDMTIDAGYYKPAKLGDYVWHDKDADGIQDPDENGINGIVVTLYDGAGNPVGNTTTGVNPVTGEDGYYIFDNLKPGTYYVCFNKGSYDKISPRDSGSNDAKDSDADPLSGCTIVTVLESGETDRTWDAGLYNLASLGDYVWLDTNVDGIQNPAEVGINGIVVNLYLDADKDGNPDGAPINTMATVTNAGNDGYYIFDNLEPGDYVVMFAPSVAHSRTLSNAGSDDTKDSDANVTTGLTHSINLISGEHDPTIDAGYYYSASLGDYTWFDEDADGIQDVGEKCLDSVRIRLYRVNTDPVTGILDTVYVGFTYSHSVLDGEDTLKCGFYEFKNLQPGKYFLVFENKNADVYTISPKERLFNRATDSNPNDKGNTATINLNPGEHNPTIDAGFYKGGCMEGQMWDENRTNPLNESCILDPLDYPLVNYRVDLIWDGNPDITTDDRLFKTDYTDATGKYEFRNIPVGEYYLVIYLPADKTLTCADAGDDKKDSDFYLSDETGQYRSHTFSITPNNDGDCKLDVKAGTDDRTFPIEIVLFEANWNETEDQVELEWQSMNEVNLSHFIVMRKGEFENRFIEIGTVEAKGSLEMNEYMLPDRDVEKAYIYHYRLIPVDKDGTKNKYYDDEVRIPGNAMKVFAYPNPTKSLLNIEVLGKANDQLRIELLDNIGKRALNDVIVEKNNNIAEKVSIDVSNLPQGNYFIKVISGNAVEVKRVAVIK